MWRTMKEDSHGLVIGYSTTFREITGEYWVVVSRLTASSLQSKRPMESRLLSIQWIGLGRQNNPHFLGEDNSVSLVCSG